MNAIDLLESQHREVERLFADIEAAGEPQRKEQLFAELADALAIHTRIEELIFYPESKEARTEGLLREAVEEHLAVKRIISDILDIEATDPTFDAKCKVLKELVEHHVEEEEGQLFAQVRKLFDDARLEELGHELEAMAAEALEAEAPRMEIPRQTDAPAPIE
jgi:hemerythrin superfamily protein